VTVDGLRVTGIGAVSACGVGAGALLSPPERPANDAPRTIDDLDAAGILGMRGLRPLSRASLLAAVAAAEALGHPADAPGDPVRRAVVVGTRWASLEPLFQFEQTAARDGPGLVNPAHFPNVVVNAHAGYLGILFGLAGPNMTLCGPGSGLEAIGAACDLLSLGRADYAVAGGVESLGEVILEGLGRNGRGKSDGPPGEAGAFLLIARGAVGGVPVAAFASGPRAARNELVARALAEAGLAPDEIGAAWSAGEAPEGLPVQRIEELTGDCGGAGGALAAVAAAAGAAASGEPALAAALPPSGTQSILVFGAGAA